MEHVLQDGDESGSLAQDLNDRDFQLPGRRRQRSDDGEEPDAVTPRKRARKGRLSRIQEMPLEVLAQVRLACA
jgi:hypothetical protein